MRRRKPLRRARQAVMTVTATPLERVELTRTIVDERLRVRMAGRHHRVRGRRLPRRRRIRRRRRSRAERAAARRRCRRRLLEAEVATKQATLKQREAELMNAQSALERGQSLASTNLLSKADLDRLTVGATGVAVAARVRARRPRDVAAAAQVHGRRRRPMTASSRRARSPSARSRRPATRCCACCATAASNGAAKRPRRGSTTWRPGRASAS